ADVVQLQRAYTAARGQGAARKDIAPVTGAVACQTRSLVDPDRPLEGAVERERAGQNVCRGLGLAGEADNRATGGGEGARAFLHDAAVTAQISAEDAIVPIVVPSGEDETAKFCDLPKLVRPTGFEPVAP